MPYENYRKNSDSLDDTLTQLVKSIAVEEEALATLMQAEANKTLAFVGKDRDLPTQPSSSEFIQFNQTVTKILDSILMVEWMLAKKIDSVKQFQYLYQPSHKPSHKKEGHPGKDSGFFEDEHDPNDDIDY
ncbi:hypothetical protein M5W83_27620 [Paenibacillus thiaminolyticus]|uniref:Uncharacterized protein n=1 Tax=Paenibacillus thiaminolyticus TaxID=49283 RepID=A0AAP9DR20_PANTH|nr:hypothetical protein [Paenibacillus thiaminolyticus]MCY9538273.1 hypothetical protein [Paenibacillus thiaminolyticus]MCY9604478.1 hypothetical protein [Paenibacillus thiaminolyticus]MCY9610919.1 hypothetical protein [Paenibacillus thiaminolyticus]MCY9616799.1 hypothetical protein [Paenibacillus thiaminolyticus]MCY9622425.1 hypothetical protein [Paenibacillus thiaminolyticus]